MRCRPLRLTLQNQTPTGHNFSLSLACNEENIGHVLHSAGGMVSVSRENLEAVTRFDVFTSHTLGAPLPRHILRTHGVSLSFKVVYVQFAKWAQLIGLFRHPISCTQ
ncbi:uncharacterized protein CIMG_11714 [Coccidioides immitis RS]|uniref:Uncharacterized protein n=1 Tax=Coccidioides immitis (strain RS) TaxID=246410 RepID=A0A0D8JT53_COCIM|nr:uncharacterized protein CIMG_11714 [Coccidioides immitis RS]KJF60535.1 hypothetical protein CIMG_11714 [Coccidioides immitis RS]